MKIKITLLTLLVTTLFSCSDPYREPGGYRGSVLGRWKTISSLSPESLIIDTTDCNSISNTGLYWTIRFDEEYHFIITNTCNGSVIERGVYTYYRNELFLEPYNITARLTIKVETGADNKIRMIYDGSANISSIPGFNIVLTRA